MLSLWIEEARMSAAQVWCHPTTEKIEMDASLAEQFAQVLAVWIDTAAQYAEDMSFYRDLLIETGHLLGLEIFISDDGSIQDEPLLLKVPELVAKLVQTKAS